MFDVCVEGAVAWHGMDVHILSFIIYLVLEMEVVIWSNSVERAKAFVSVGLAFCV